MRSFEYEIEASCLGNAVVLRSSLRKTLGVIALALMITVWGTQASASDPARFALLIGNQDYTSAVGTLKNPKNDLAVIKLALLKVGFAEAEITVVANADRISMLENFDKFAERVSGAGQDAISFFYYSGHGLSDERRDNFLIPVDVPEIYSSTFRYLAVALRDLLLKLSEDAPKAKNFVIFDACRNTLKLKQPGNKGMTEPKGFQPVQDIPGGMLIAFATAEGELASDLGEEAGPYARALAEEIVRPGVEAITVFRNVQLKVSENTGQKPWTQNGPMSAVYLAGREPTQIRPQYFLRSWPRVVVRGSEAAAQRWKEIKETEDIRIFELFRKQYGASDPLYDALARARIAELEAEQPQPGVFRSPYKAFRPREAAIEKPQAIQPPQRAVALAQRPDIPVMKEPARAARAEPAQSPLLEASASLPAGFKFKDCDFCPPLVVVPGGEFQMGSDEHPHEKPAHKVRIPRPFAIGQYEVTYAEWDRCVDEGACRYRPEHQGFPGDAIGNLSWDDANTYLKWMSQKTGQIYRLPSEAEWEYAARAGTTKRFWWGDEAGSGKANCADSGSGNGQPAPAGSYNPNPFGLYDTAGNMAEWVEDCWNASYDGAPKDGSAWLKGNCSLRGLRGGSLGTKANSCRSPARFRYDSDVRYEANGFRVLRELR